MGRFVPYLKNRLKITAYIIVLFLGIIFFYPFYSSMGRLAHMMSHPDQ